MFHHFVGDESKALSQCRIVVRIDEIVISVTIHVFGKKCIPVIIPAKLVGHIIFLGRNYPEMKRCQKAYKNTQSRASHKYLNLCFLFLYFGQFTIITGYIKDTEDVVRAFVLYFGITIDRKKPQV